MHVATGCLLSLCLMATSSRSQQPESGITHELARARAAAVSNVRYELEFELHEGMQSVEGRARVTFDLPDAAPPDQPLILDFAGELIGEPDVNGFPRAAGTVRSVHDHLVLPPETLTPGRNSFEARIRADVAAAGAPVTSYRTADGEELFYTLLVPADAHRLFPCFDQPDLKAVFSLTLTAPANWQVVGNAPVAEAPERTEQGDMSWRFEDTQRLSTYLFAFAAGAFEVIDGGSVDDIPLRIFVRPERRRELDVTAIAQLHARALHWLSQRLGVPYPFGKLDAVLIPGFPYGGMEHAGAIFYSEPAVVFDHEPTENELTRRSTLVYHETTHQWFGNLVTMTWFDDLWLKEGFATFVSYVLLDELQPQRLAWLRFHQRVKPAALRVDVTAGTTPVYQELQNLAAAKSNYGAIVYDKAPAVLHELYARLGSDAFMRGVRAFLRDHAFGNATWQDLVDALEKASDTDLGRWSKSWVLTRGLPIVRVRWDVMGDGSVQSFEVVQEDALGEGHTWPLHLDLLLQQIDGSTKHVVVDSTAQVTEVPELVGEPAPAAVLPNPGDVAYGLFLLDPASRDYFIQHPPDALLTRAVVMADLFDAVRETELDPSRFADIALNQLATESDPETHSWLLDTLHTTAWRYLHPPDRDRVVERATGALLAQIREHRAGVALQSFRFLAWTSSRPEVYQLCEQLLDGSSDAPLEVGTEDRYLALAALIAAGRGGRWVAAMTGDRTPRGAERYAFLAPAAEADAATKKRYFAAYLQPDEPPEQWMQESLAYFHWPGQEGLTLPYLEPALEQLEWVQQHRKIFFMPGWIDGFVNGHSSKEALDVVEAFLAKHDDLPPDITRKVLQSLDGLRRAVAIKERWK